MNIIEHRLANQKITEPTFAKPQQVVSHMLAMQAQEYAIAKWAIGMRGSSITEVDVEKALTDGHILRTHVMRPTWHFVAPEDIRWLLQLTAPRIFASYGAMLKKMDLDEKVFKRSNNVIAKTLEGGQFLNRAALKAALQKAKIDTGDTVKLSSLVMRAELDGIICSGPREGKQFTYALLDERVPAPKKTFTKEEALTEIARRYFSTRGPATIHDFVWWSGLTVKEAREGVGYLPSKFTRETIDGKEYIFLDQQPPKLNQNATFLMADYDEYGISYKDRSAAASLVKPKEPVSPYSHMLVVEGRLAGTWKAIDKKGTIEVGTSTFTHLNKTQQQAVNKAIKRYKEFIES